MQASPLLCHTDCVQKLKSLQSGQHHYADAAAWVSNTAGRTQLSSSYYCYYYVLIMVTVVPAEGNGDLHTLICVLVARHRRCLTLSNPVP